MLKLLLTSVCQIFGIFLITFLILHLIPGDPILVMMGESSSLADQEKLRSELGLDKSIIEQIINSIGQLAQGNFGTSILRSPVYSRSQNKVKIMQKKSQRCFLEKGHVLTKDKRLLAGTQQVGAQNLGSK